MRIESLRDLTKDELLQKQEELKQEMFNLKMRKGVRELDNPLRMRTLRRSIARIETVLHEDRKGLRRIVDQAQSLLDQADGKKQSADKK
jgi:large subunit ribosomal protein L29